MRLVERPAEKFAPRDSAYSEPHSARDPSIELGSLRRVLSKRSNDEPAIQVNQGLVHSRFRNILRRIRLVSFSHSRRPALQKGSIPFALSAALPSASGLRAIHPWRPQLRAGVLPILILSITRQTLDLPNGVLIESIRRFDH